MPKTTLTKEVLKELSEPFPEEVLGWKPQAFNQQKTRALAVPHITSRLVMDRLDEVVGPAEWHTDFVLIPGLKAAKVMLTVLGVTKSDIGFVAGDDDAAIKGTVSDGLKRAAVLFGIGRYLYGAETKWLGWDNKDRKFTEEPRLILKNGPREAPPADPEKKHWIEYGGARNKFWAMTKELTLSNEQVHEALGVESVKDYEGTMAEAKKQIEEWIEIQMEEKEK